MPNQTVHLENKAVTEQVPASGWKLAHGYKLHLLITKDDDGIFSAVALNLPGVGSCGDSREEAVSNAREAAAGVLESYKDSNENIPWRDSTEDEIPAGAEQRWIIVNG